MKHITFIIVILFLVQIVSFSAVIPTEVAPVNQDNQLSMPEGYHPAVDKSSW